MSPNRAAVPFTQADPLPAVHGAPFVSSYAYANNRPTAMVDPAGLRAQALAYLGNEAQVSSYGLLDKLAAGDWGALTIDDIQLGVSYLGVIPGIGDALDVVNGVVYLARGKWEEAAWSLVAVVPIVGSAALARHAVRHADAAVAAGRRLRVGGDQAFSAVGARRVGGAMQGATDDLATARSIGRTADNASGATPAPRSAYNTSGGSGAMRVSGRRGASVSAVDGGAGAIHGPPPPYARSQYGRPGGFGAD